jgi:hypothetical protein
MWIGELDEFELGCGGNDQARMEKDDSEQALTA